MTLNGRHQDWKAMAVLWPLLTAILTYPLGKYTWSIGTNWLTFNQHQAQWLYIIREHFLNRSYSLEKYQEYLLSNNLLVDFWLHLLIPTFLSSLIAAFFTYKFLYIDGGLAPYKYKSGIKLLVNKHAVRHHRKHTRFNSVKSSLPLHPKIPLLFQELSGNLIALGSQGSGKSTMLKPILQSLIEQDRYAFIYDAKQEYTERFYSEHKILINPFDKRSSCWNISQDIQSEVDAQKVAEAFIQHTGGDQFWVDGARQIFIGILISLKNEKNCWTWKDLNSQLNLSVAQLKQAVSKHYPIADKLVEEDSKTTQSFLTVLNTQLFWISSISELWSGTTNKSFSIKAWLKLDSIEKQVIVSNLPKYNQVTSSICGSLIALAATELLSQPDNDRQFWLFLDELADLPKTKALLDWLSKGRSKGARAVCATQSVSQLYSKYGDKDAETLISLFSNKIILRTNSFEASERLSKSVGKQTIEYKSKSINSDNNTSFSTQEKEVHAVPPELIMQLPPPDKHGVTGILTEAGYEAAYYLKWPYPELEKIAEGFIPLKLKLSTTPQQRRGSRGRNKIC